MIKFVALFDLHAPEHSRSALNVALKFIKDFKPQIIILGGDFMNLSCISHWKEGKMGSLLGEDIERDYKIGNEILDKLECCSPMAEIIYLEGNHEQWIKQYGDLYPSVGNIIKLETNLHFVERKIKFVPMNKVYFLGKLGFMHGIYTGTHHTLQTIRAGYNASIRYGHTHDRQVDTLVSPADSRNYFTIESCGCMCEMDAEFMKGKPSRWMKGFQFGYVNQNTGNFNDYFVKILPKKTVIMGKEYLSN